MINRYLKIQKSLVCSMYIKIVSFLPRLKCIHKNYPSKHIFKFNLFLNSDNPLTHTASSVVFCPSECYFWCNYVRLSRWGFGGINFVNRLTCAFIVFYYFLIWKAKISRILFYYELICVIWHIITVIIQVFKKSKFIETVQIIQYYMIF